MSEGQLIVKAVVFDLDGTLLDTLDDIAECMNAALAAHRLFPYGRDRYRKFVGDGAETLARRALASQ
ncbi:MAG: HAD hydrolase-like protein, partial [Oscillospiraceae bacterium]|nr:HAD hydrolase-like protein [Oscillospiraceae bacterium]